MRVRAIVLALSLLTLSVVSTDAQQQTSPPPCAGPEFRQFDFWVGEWTVHANDKVSGHSHISNIQNGCTILEEYSSANGRYEGKSFNYYDPTDSMWHQIWVDSGGLRLHLSGSYADGKMTLSGTRMASGVEIIDRITWHNNTDGTVRQVWDMSKDGGETWNPLFDGLYTQADAAGATDE